MYRITAEWQQQVRDELQRIGLSREQLGKDIGHTKGAITQMLAEGKKQSRLVPKVCARLNIPMPLWQDSREMKAVEKMRRIRDLNNRKYDALLERIDREFDDLDLSEEE